jgi:RHS repeat-associated protein
VAVGVVGATVAIGIGCGSSNSAQITPAEAAPGSPSALQVPDPPKGTAGYDPRSLPALPAGTAQGPQVPTLAVTLDGSLGLSTSVTPTLTWPDGPSSGVDWTVSDLAGKQVVAEQGQGNSIQVPKGALKGGVAYLWSARAGGKTFGPHLMRVDTQRADVQGVVNYAGVAVTTVTGEPMLSFSTRPLATAAGGAGVSLSYQPTNRQLGVPAAGVPAGWALSASSGASWTMLRRPAADRIELTTTSGQVVPFRQTSPGAWIAEWGKGQQWPSGQFAVLAQAQGVAGAPLQITDRSGQVTTFPDTAVGTRSYPTSTWSAKNPAPQASYDQQGRLIRITDPVSDRQVSLIYSTPGNCPDPQGDGLIAAPKGMLCRITGWDGQITDIQYATRAGAPVIARVINDAQGGGQRLSQTDIGYDASGRPDRLRAPLANAAIAAGVLPGIGAGKADEPAVLTSITYDPQGRVAGLTRPAAILSARQGTIPEQGSRTFSYPQAGNLVTRQPGRSQPISESVASPSTMLTTRTADSVGRTTETTWDSARQAPTQITAPGGMITRYGYDQMGRQTTVTGPSADPDSVGAPQVSYLYDTKVSSASQANPVAIEGLQATYWQGAAFQGTPAGTSVGPRINDRPPASLDLRWPQSPVGTGAFSARLEGVIVVPEGGIRQITNRVESSGVWIDGIRCQDACPSQLGLASKKPGDMLQVRIDLRSSPGGVATIGVAWTTAAGTTAIPATALRPALPQATATTVRDQLRPDGSLVNLTTQSTYSPSDPQQLVAARSASGKVATRAYEPYAPGSGAFGRATGFTSTGKDVTTTDYYAPGEAAQTSCPGASANQGGLARAKTTPGGLATINAYDQAGNIVGQQATGQPATCITYDTTGAVTRMVTGSVATAYDYAVGDNPMYQRTTIRDGTTRTTEAVTDLLGRNVRSTDVWGTTVITSYDSEDRPVQMATTTAKGQRTITTYAYTADGQVQNVTRDGQDLAQVGYQDSTGWLSGVEYSNGSTASLSYDASGSVNERTFSVAGESITESVALSPAQRTLRRQIDGAGTSATWGYSYDKDGRLTSANLSGETSLGAPTGTWAYELNGASERTRITSPNTPKEGFTYSYGTSGRMTATSDTRFANRFAYDDAGRATRVGAITLGYDPTGTVERISDGQTTESRVLAAGAIIATAISTPSGQQVIRYSASGLMLDTDGMINSQMVSLPGGVDVQLPPPAAPADTGGPSQASTTPAATTATTTPATTETAPTPPATVQPLPIWRYSDLQGSVAWTATADQAPSATTLYDPDGNRLGNAPALSTDPSRPNLLFEGASTSPLSTPVAQMGARSYVPALGIFLQPDPVPNGSTTAYNYAAGDPINSSDASGNNVFTGAWWKENGGQVLRVGIAVVVGTAVGVLTAGTGASVGAAIAVGIASAAVGGAAGDYLGQVAANYVNGATGEAAWSQVNWAEISISAGVSAVLAGAGAGLRTYRAARAAAARVKADQLAALNAQLDDLAETYVMTSRKIANHIHRPTMNSEGLVANFNEHYGSNFTLISKGQLRALKSAARGDAQAQKSIGVRGGSNGMSAEARMLLGLGF